MQYNRAVAADPHQLLADVTDATATSPAGVVKLGGGPGRACMCRLAQGAPLVALLDAPTRALIAAAIAPAGDASSARPAGAAVAATAAAVAPARTLSSMFGLQVALRFPMAPFADGVADGDAALPGLLGVTNVEYRDTETVRTRPPLAFPVVPLPCARCVVRALSGAPCDSHAAVRGSWHTDAAKYNAKKTFDVVVGLFLSDVVRPSDGVLWVQPGSHTRERIAREAGTLADGALCTDEAARVRALDAASSVPILARAGTAIVFDKDLVHAGGPNLSSAIRHALYARMRFEVES